MQLGRTGCCLVTLAPHRTMLSPTRATWTRSITGRSGSGLRNRTSPLFSTPAALTFGYLHQTVYSFQWVIIMFICHLDIGERWVYFDSLKWSIFLVQVTCFLHSRYNGGRSSTHTSIRGKNNITYCMFLEGRWCSVWGTYICSTRKALPYTVRVGKDHRPFEQGQCSSGEPPRTESSRVSRSNTK